MKYKIFRSDEPIVDNLTVVYEDGNYTTMSDKPFHPQGFCQHGAWLDFNGDLSQLGVEINYTDLNDDCQKVIQQDLIYC